MDNSIQRLKGLSCTRLTRRQISPGRYVCRNSIQWHSVTPFGWFRTYTFRRSTFYARRWHSTLAWNRRHFWRNVKKVQLKISMRVQMQQVPSSDTFSKQLLDIGDGKVTVHENTGCIKFSTDFCIIIDSQNSFIDRIFPYVRTHFIFHAWLAERTILTAKICTTTI